MDDEIIWMTLAIANDFKRNILLSSVVANIPPILSSVVAYIPPILV